MAGKVFFSVSMSLDGFIAPASLGDLMGQQWMELQQWVFPLRFFRENLKLGEGGEEGVAVAVGGALLWHEHSSASNTAAKRRAPTLSRREFMRGRISAERTRVRPAWGASNGKTKMRGVA